MFGAADEIFLISSGSNPAIARMRSGVFACRSGADQYRMRSPACTVCSDRLPDAASVAPEAEVAAGEGGVDHEADHNMERGTWKRRGRSADLYGGALQQFFFSRFAVRGSRFAVRFRTDADRRRIADASARCPFEPLEDLKLLRRQRRLSCALVGL